MKFYEITELIANLSTYLRNAEHC